MNTCINCKKDTNNKKFCSRSCCISYWNKRKPKRKSTGTTVCPNCGCFKYNQSTLCVKCKNNLKETTALNSPISYYIRDKNKSSAKYNEIRAWAKKVLLKSGRKKVCEICGFSARVDVCHKRAIGSFSKDSLLKEVNNIDNLIYLCPNHHALFDMGLIDI